MSEPVIGREQELDAIDSFLGSVDAGPSVLLLEGEAGIGKTTLWRAGIAEAARRSLRVLRSSPVESEAKLSFAVLGDLLGEAFDEAVGRLPAPQRRALAVALLEEDAGGPPPEQRAVATAFLGALRTLALERPVIVAIDDVQWLDEPSATAVSFAIRRVREEPVRFLLAQRTEGASPRPLGLDRDPDAKCERVHIGPFSLAALQHMLRERLGAGFARPTLRQLHETARGNPFFALELARALHGGHVTLVAGEPLPVPDEVRVLVRERLADMPTDTTRVLRAAALLAEATIDRIADATGLDVEAACGPAIRARVVGLTGGTIEFDHPLFASAVVDAMPPEVRRALHRRVAATAMGEEERARHVALGAEHPDEAVATELQAAAAAVAARGAPASAAELAELAQRLTPSERLEEVHARAVDAGWYAWAAGDCARARRLFEDVIASAPRGRQRADALDRLARLEIQSGDICAAPDLCLAALAEAGDDPGLRAGSYELLAWSLLLIREDIPAALRQARATVELAEQLGRPVQLAEGLAVEAQAAFFLGGGLPSAPMERALALEPATEGELRALRQPRLHWSLLLQCADELDAARRELEQVRAVALANGDESAAPWVLMRLAHVELLAGHWQRAAELVEEGYELAALGEMRPLEACLACTRALLEAHRGREGLCRASADQGLTLARANGVGIAVRLGGWALGLLELSVGNAAAAEAVLTPLREESESAGIVEPGENRYLGDLIEALVELDRLDEAEALTRSLRARGEALGRAATLAVAGRCRGLLLSARGDTEGAFAALEAALGHHEGVPRPFERGRTLLVLGATQRRLKRKSDARASLEAARQVFDDLGAPLWAVRAAGELARIGGRAPSRGGLTATERRVAALVSEGRTNREVASVLYVTDRTVESHLSHIYAKLGVRSRAELAHRYHSGD